MSKELLKQLSAKADEIPEEIVDRETIVSTVVDQLETAEENQFLLNSILELIEETGDPSGFYATIRDRLTTH